MPGSASLPLRVALAAGLLLIAGAGGSFAQQRVGINSAVNQDATGAAPGVAPRRLVIGQNVIFNEHITTAARGQTQLLFLDESSMTIGPNSDLTIDQFVYDPKSGTGKLAMSATRGLLRYVGGKLSKQDNAVTLRTSTATLAVRGGAFIANIDRNGKTQAVFIYGDALQVTGLGGFSETLRRPGFEVTVSGPGAAPSSPAPMPAGQLAQFNRQLDGRTGGTGGATVVPTNAAVASSGISQTISGNVAASVQQAVQNQVSAPQGTQTTSTSSTQTTGSTQSNTAASQIINCASAGNCPSGTTQAATTSSGQTVGGSGGNPATQVAISYAGQGNSSANAAQGFVSQGIPYSAGTQSFPTGVPQSGVFTANVGNLGTVSFPLALCSSAGGCSASFTNGTSSNFGAITGTSFMSADNTFFYANITPTGEPAQRLFISGGIPVNSSVYQPTGGTRVFAFTVQPDAALQSSIPFIRSQTGGNLAGAAVSPFYVVAPAATTIGNTSTASGTRALQASLAINGQGASQQSVIAVTTGTIASQSNGQPIFTGQLRGSSLTSATGTPVRLSSNVTSTVDGNGNSFYGGSAISGFVLDQSATTSTTGGTVTAVSPSTAAETPLSGTATPYGFAQPATAAAVPAGVGTSRTTQAQNGFFGGLMYTTAQPNPYSVTGSAVVSTDAPNNRVAATLSGSAQSPSSGVNTLAMQYGSLSGAPGGQAFVDDNTFAATESQVNPQQINGQPAQAAGSYLVSSGTTALPTSLLPSGASYCQCQYLHWGYWGGGLTGSTANPSRVDVGNINTWVAGVPTTLTDFATLAGQGATATYSGAAIGSVFNNGASYVAAGGFNGTYNFGTQVGTWAVNNFDGHSISASGSAPLTGGNYAFVVNNPGVKGTVNGAFYGPLAAETGGNFAFQTTSGPAYLASGIFAGKR